MNKRKRKLTSNIELAATCVMTVFLEVFSYFILVLIESDNKDKVEVLIIFLKDFGTYALISDCLPSCLLVWCFLGLVNRICRTSKVNLSTGYTLCALISILLYSGWYVLYTIYREYLGTIIVNYIAFIIELVIMVIFFHKKKVM